MAKPAKPNAKTIAQQVAVQERKTAKKLLRTEMKNARALQGSIKRASAQLVASVAAVPPGMAMQHATAHIRHILPALQQDAHREIAAGRRNARAAGRERVAESLDEEPAKSEHGETVDETAAAASSSSLASAWATAAIGLVAANAGGQRDMARALTPLHKQMDGRVSRMAATETAAAFNDERAAAALAVDEVRPLVQVWSAIIDGRTCDRCAGMDGTMRRMGASFPEGINPPLHPFCRCIIEFIPMPQGFGDEGEVGPSSGIREALIEEREAPAAIAEPAPPPRAPEPPPPPAPPPPPPEPAKPAMLAAAEQLGAQVRFPEDTAAIAEKIFGAGNVPDADGWRRMWQVPEGYEVKFARFRTDGEELVVAAKIMQGDAEVGEIENTFLRKDGKLISKLDYIEVSDAHQGKGFAQSIMRSSVAAYQDLGVDHIELIAGMSAGKYAWARYGFSWDEDYAKSVLVDLKAFLTRKLPARSAAEINVLAQSALLGAHAVAALEVDGERLGKEFLLGTRPWRGTLKLKDGDLGFELAKKRLAATPEEIVQARTPKAGKTVIELPTAAKHDKIASGVHINVIVNDAAKTNVDADRLEQIFAPINSHRGAIEYLEKNPLGSLVMEPRESIQGEEGAGGIYDKVVRSLRVAADMPYEFGGPKWKPGHSFSTAGAPGASGNVGSLQAIFTHELGHHLHLHDWEKPSFDAVDKVIQDAFARLRASDVAITRYARENHLEYWAENFASYILHHDDLLAVDPNGYKMVKDVLKLRGIE